MENGSNPLNRPAPRHSKWVYVLPSLHLTACLSLPLAYVMPSALASYCGLFWTFVMLADLPVSFPAYILAWHYELQAAAWIFVVGTLWWFFLSRTAESVVLRLRHRGTNTTTS
jgi:hypothetical protein